MREHALAAARRNDVAVICNEGGSREAAARVRVSHDVQDGLRTLRIKYRRPPLHLAPHLAYRSALRTAVRTLAADGFVPDLIHAHFYHCGVTAVRLGRRLGVPVVVSEHSTTLRPGVIGAYAKRRARFALENAHLVCPASEDLARQIAALGIRARMRPVPNVADTSLFAPRGVNGRAGPPRILFVAALIPRKGLHVLLRGLAQLRDEGRDFVLDVVGDGAQRAELETLVAQLRLGEHVTFHGLRGRKEVAEFMRRASFLVLPSFEENLPCVIVEALASGLPVVASDVGGVSEMVDRRTGSLVPAGDIDALAAAMRSMLDRRSGFDREEIARLAASRYSYEAVGRIWSEIYRELVTA